MYGALARALSARKVEFDPDTYTADVLGTIEGDNNQTIRITKIHVIFHLPDISDDQRAAAERAVKFHTAGCPAHQSVKDAIAITHEADYGDG